MIRNLYANDFQGMSNEVFEKLRTFGIQTTDELIAKLNDPNVRRDVAQKTGVNEPELIKWTKMADLMRVSGVSKQYGELLFAAGVTSLEQLRGHKPEDLVRTLEQAHGNRKVFDTAPKLPEVQGWINEARTLDTLVTV
ncbi:MAG: DUF4332 domain-containing protein [Candidatus Eiseniibacteriota bacterium]